jgi:CheY-like chemotaxis protein
MRGIAELLSPMEQEAENFYRKATDSFQDDKEFSEFLLLMAEEEASHFLLLQHAINYFTQEESSKSPIILDPITKEKIEKQFADATATIEANGVCKDKCISEIINLELSELNNIFQYVLNYLAPKQPEFADAAAEVAAHTAHVQSFIENDPSLAKYRERFKAFPKIGETKILIVDDEPFIVEFLKNFLRGQGEIDTALNGLAALDKIKAMHFNLIISDLNMPKKGGVELYNDVVKMYPDIGSRFLFFSGFVSNEYEAFIRDNNLHYLTKPAAINEIHQKCAAILHGFTEIQ